MLITSIGSVCFTKWQVCNATGLEYLHCPLDNIQNNGIRQFDNILALLKEGYRQVEGTALEYREHAGTRLDGQAAEYHGYRYIGDQLSHEFILAHFFDGNKIKTYLSEDEAWSRWHHKCQVFGEALESGEELALVSLRLEDDDAEARAYLWHSLLKLAEYIRLAYNRDETNTHLISLIATDAQEVTTEHQTPMAAQILIPSAEEKGTPYYKRQYRDEYKDAVLKHLGDKHNDHQHNN